MFNVFVLLYFDIRILTRDYDKDTKWQFITLQSIVIRFDSVVSVQIIDKTEQIV